MTAFFIIIGCIAIAIYVLGTYGNNKQKKYENSEIERLKKESIELFDCTKNYDGIIGVDNISKKIVIINSKFSKTHLINFQDIIDCEINKDGQTVFKKSLARTVGGVVVGGVVFGGVGALIGGLSGSSKANELINKIEIVIVAKNMSQRNFRFVFYHKSYYNKALLNKSISQADSWVNKVLSIIEHNNK